ncbi:N-acetylmuramoyl-L-alanine amidase family protein [Novosphingobium jiangmenense]|uniref:N-acetylmuramoyl-L-alanine amidase n=1 Tax=Novosphingobium jiangmenense TaxID=2791981 RepID=A0ABS0HDH6_9SPHN|nr:N-acetylmuramoyl-L-alanine amidase [Novosphingobium jiangmenense]MBF9150307.1 N-acetylmuramoyl-L-alanine amidase [Novosphingobium jiangmenense]
MENKGVLIAVFAAPVAAAALMWAAFSSGLADIEPRSVLRIEMPPSSGRVGLPPVEGPADVSRPLVVIDAGHGGHDPGASGAAGEREKELTLLLAQSLREALLAAGKVRVAMTRDTDRFLVLEERADIAHRLGADLFVSVHADAAQNDTAQGATVYTLSDKASDGVAEALAARENKADTVNGVNLEGQGAAVSSILVDLARREMRGRSLRFGELVVREGKDAVRFHETPQREAAFVVLKSLDLPSALIEAGYISNAEDAQKMRDPAWRKVFAGSVARAIEIFLAEGQVAPVAVENTATP